MKHVEFGGVPRKLETSSDWGLYILCIQFCGELVSLELEYYIPKGEKVL